MLKCILTFSFDIMRQGISIFRTAFILITIGFTPIIIQNILAKHVVAAETTLPSGVSHVIVILLENADYSSIIGSSTAPYMTNIAHQYAHLSDYHGISHPSLPNYIGIIAGSSLNITDDKPPIKHTSIAENKVITSRIDSKGLSWKAYMESMSSPCDKSSNGLYAVKHNPFVYFDEITSDPIYCNTHIVDFIQLEQDIRTDNFPNIAFVTPNIKNDGHDTGVSFSDSWLKAFLPKITNSQLFDTSLIFITFDEDRHYTKENHIYATVVGPQNLVKSGFNSTTTYDHYSLLATIENIYGLGNLGRNDAVAKTIDDVFQKPTDINSGPNISLPITATTYWPLIAGLLLIFAAMTYTLYKRHTHLNR
jgi:hypothetical protein